MVTTQFAFASNQRLLAFVTLVGCLAVALEQQAAGQLTVPLPPRPGQIVPGQEHETDLETVLKQQLRVILPQEEAYIEKVVELTEADQLPEDMVITSLLWARRKPRMRVRYFERALILRASRLGLTAPQIELDIRRLPHRSGQ